MNNHYKYFPKINESIIDASCFFPSYFYLHWVSKIDANKVFYDCMYKAELDKGTSSHPACHFKPACYLAPSEIPLFTGKMTGKMSVLFSGDFTNWETEFLR